MYGSARQPRSRMNQSINQSKHMQEDIVDGSKDAGGRRSVRERSLGKLWLKIGDLARGTIDQGTPGRVDRAND